MNTDFLKKAGRLLAVGFDGTEPGDHSKTALRELMVGNWILFARNIEGHQQIRDLTRYLQEETKAYNGYSPLITIDQEGGIVSRLHGSLNTYPGAMACAATGTTANSRRAAEITAEHLRILGFSVNLAPVADINSNPRNPIVGPRSFGDSPESVTEHLLSSCQGYLRGGILPVIKHFPGHGDSSEDSHLSLPTLTHSKKLLMKRELFPYSEAIKQGIPAIMVAHLLLPSLSNKNLPASLNPDIVEGLLRKQMGFQGLVMTDCLEMQGIQLGYETGEAVLLALEAGADLCFISHRLDRQEAGIRAIYDALQKGRLKESRVDRSLLRQEKSMDRISAAKEKHAQYNLPLRLPVREMEQISQESMTVVRNRMYLSETGLENSRNLHIIYISRPEQFIGESTVLGGDPLGNIHQAFPLAAYRELKADCIKEEIARKPLDLDHCRKLLVITSDCGFFPEAVSAIQQWTELGIPTGIIVMRTPYEAAYFPKADFILLTYEDTALASSSVISLLRGEFKARGKCPVQIPGLV